MKDQPKAEVGGYIYIYTGVILNLTNKHKKYRENDLLCAAPLLGLVFVH